MCDVINYFLVYTILVTDIFRNILSFAAQLASETKLYFPVYKCRI